MFNPATILKALPSFWTDAFSDKPLLRDIYSYIGEYLGDVYAQTLEPVSALSVVDTPLSRVKPWSIIALSSQDRLQIRSGDTDSTQAVYVYGLLEYDYLTLNCSRIYAHPSPEADYLEGSVAYELFHEESREVADLVKLSGNPTFFSRYTRFIVFYDLDPLYYFDSAEPTTRLVDYPLVIKINSDLIGNTPEQDLVATTVTVSYSETQVTSDIIGVVPEGQYSLLLLSPDTFSVYIDDATVTVTGLTEDPIVASIYASYAYEVDDINLWARDCEVDELQLFRRWGHLIADNIATRRPIQSSDRYKLLLEQSLENRLLGLSASRLAKTEDILSGSDTIAFSSLNDTLSVLDLVNDRLVSYLTDYTILPGYPIDRVVASNTLSILAKDGSRISMSSCALVSLASSAYAIATRALNSGVAVYLKDPTDNEVGIARLACSDNTIVVQLLVSLDSLATLPSLRLYYLENEFISIPSGLFTVGNPAQFAVDPQGRAINPVSQVVDLNSGLSEWYNRGLILPRTIWDVPEVSRREVTTRRTRFIIGDMPNHRLGDYELYIPDSSREDDYYDKPSLENPEGWAYSTSYKLTRDFLTTKVALLVPSLNDLGTKASYLSGDIVDAQRDLSKVIIPVISNDLVDFVPTAQDSLEVSIEVDGLAEDLVTQSYTGIGTSGLLLRVMSEGHNLSNFMGIELVSPIDGAPLATEVRGYSEDELLLELSDELVLDLSGYTQVDLLISGQQSTWAIVVATNYVGSSSELMVVGASYPEYTDLYNFSPNTVSEWLQVGLEEPFSSI